MVLGQCAFEFGCSCSFCVSVCLDVCYSPAAESFFSTSTCNSFTIPSRFSTHGFPPKTFRSRVMASFAYCYSLAIVATLSSHLQRQRLNAT